MVNKLRAMFSHSDKTVNMAVGRAVTFPEIGHKKSRVIKGLGQNMF